MRKPRQPIPRQSLKTKARKASADGKAGAFYMAQVARLPCVICGASPVQVHHVICGRFGSRKASDFDTIPLCPACHLDPDGIHANKAAWVARHGDDRDYLPAVAAMVAGLICD
jgi:hypothetical protein